ncbi:hypothetical protein DFP72DRAFT_840719 [Ephemerocybe angulata]|uniref:Uncharacterized protein n=1 Tax=Ephemerocybe angulata TaxID=980116 RepID=A0A8H6IDG7_9AGAR|nr:hypothetical protein DFP72DRAFT_840719 [Tulosesus angulatus]
MARKQNSAPRKKPLHVRTEITEAERIERRREISRNSSRKFYYKDIMKSRERAAESSRKSRAEESTGKIQKRSRVSETDEERLERCREASRNSSMKHYKNCQAHLHISAPQEILKGLEQKVQSVLEDIEKDRGSHAPSTLKHNLNAGKQAALSTPSTPPRNRRTHRECTSPPHTPTFRQLAASSPDSSRSSSRSSLPALTPSPSPQFSPSRKRLPQLPPGPDWHDQHDQIFNSVNENEQDFLFGVWRGAEEMREGGSRDPWRELWNRSYRQEAITEGWFEHPGGRERLQNLYIP